MTHQRRLNAARITAAVALALAVGSRAWGAGAEPGAPPDYGFEFATVTHAGNAARAITNPLRPPSSAGRVDYAYRIATTEVTRAQWVEFVRAYAPFTASNEQSSLQMLGNGIIRSGTIQGVPQYVVAEGPNWWADPGWRYAARYVNWLHNGKKPAGVATAADFASGAYDTSTFVVKNGVALDQRARSPGALFWIPNIDEWVKAAYFDPNRYGEGQAGYWDYPITSDSAPIPGLPGDGGQTNTGFFPAPFEVGQYPTVQSPWGLLDVSGGGQEYLEDWQGEFTRLRIGSRTGSTVSPEVSDLYLRVFGVSPTSFGFTLRIASAVPAPGPGLMVGGFAAVGFARRRRRMAGSVRRSRAALGGACALALSVAGNAQGLAHGQAPPNYGFNFATVTHAGNAPTQTFPRPGFPTLTVGAVSHEYRISTTETTNAQWFNFVQAYAPFVNPNSWTSESFIGRDIFFQGVSGGAPQYFLPPSRAQRPSEIGWAMAARFCNWSHNGQKGVGEAAAGDFEAGAYDMSRYLTPGWDSAHTPEAKHWIPTMDEWVKAAYWDPNKNGPGEPGYWAYPITSDAAPIAGEPGSGGQTNAGPFPPGQVRPLDVGSYPMVTSPWGLLDASGGLEEWVQNPSIGVGEHRIVGSTYRFEFDPANADLLVRTYGNGDLAGGVGFRIASAVPSPMAAPALLALAALARRSRELARLGR